MEKLEAFILTWVIIVRRATVDLVSILIHSLPNTRYDKIRIILYHRICDLPKVGEKMDSLNVSPKAFSQQMDYLSQNGFNVITLEQYISYKDDNMALPPKAIIITFDDGYKDNYINAYPILKEHKFNGTFFVTTDYVCSNVIFSWLKLGEKSLAHFREYEQSWLPLTRENILEMSVNGACIGSHTRKHTKLTCLNREQAMDELKVSKQYLEDMLHKSVTCFSYPYGCTNSLVRKWVMEAGYRGAVITKNGYSTLKSDPLNLKRITIYGQDSQAKFIRKVDGAYDWWFSLIPLVNMRPWRVFRGRKKTMSDGIVFRKNLI